MPDPKKQTDNSYVGSDGTLVTSVTGTNDTSATDQAKLQDTSQLGKIAAKAAADRAAKTGTNESAEGDDPSKMSPLARAAYFKKQKSKQNAGGTATTITTDQAANALAQPRQ